MKAFIVVLALALVSARGQVVQVAPTNYALTITAQNNNGIAFQNWVTDNRDEITLGARILTVTHRVYFNGVRFMGAKAGAPPLLEDRIVYRQIGGATYRPVGGESVIYYAQKAAGGWIAATNTIAAGDLANLDWLPDFVGTRTVGDAYFRTTITASALVCHGRNIASAAYVTRVPCHVDSQWFILPYRFEGSEIKLISLGVSEANFLNNGPTIHCFEFDLDSATDEQAL